MQSQPQITFRGIPHSDAVEANILNRTEKLEKFYKQIVACRITVESEHHRHHKGNLYHVRIELDVPEKNIVVNRENHAKHEHEDIYVVIRDAFDAARMKLVDYVQIRRGNVKNHQSLLHQDTSDLFINEDL